MAPRVAIVHDDLTQRGGAERVVLSLLRLYPDADVYAGVYDPAGTFEEFGQYEVRTTALQRLPHRGNWARALLPLYPWAFRRLVLRGYDLVISSSSRFAHHVTVEGGVHVCYCYSPARFLYRQDEYFVDGAPVPTWSHRLLGPLLRRMQEADREAASRAQHYLAISHETARRIDSAYGRRAPVIPPPVDVRRLTPAAADTVPRDPYVLIVSRLLPYKRVDLAVDAAGRAGVRAVVVGEGPCRRLIEDTAGPGVELRGNVSEAELMALLAGCIALVQAGTEDFGLMPLEANAAGRPVVAVAKGGAIETVIDGITGFLVEEDAAAIARAITRASELSWRSDLLQRHAAWFAESRFHAQLAAAFETLVGAHTTMTLPEVAEMPVARDAELRQPASVG